MLKFGVVSEVDPAKGLARVNFEEDDFVSGWLKVAVPRSAADQFSFPLTINEHVYCIMDENWEYGVVAGSIYDETNTPAGAADGVMQWRFRDGSAISYDTNSRTLKLDIKGDINIACESANIQSSGEVKLEATQVSIIAVKTKIEGILEVSGAAVIQGVVSMGGLSGISGAPVTGNDAEISVKKLTATEDVLSGTVSLKTHIHTSAAPGSPTTIPITT
jgi:phage baseplate assembly protein V